MQPRAQNLNLRTRRKRVGFYNTIKAIASIAKHQQSLPDVEKMSLNGLIRNQIIQDSCAWVSQQTNAYYDMITHAELFM